MRNMSRTLGVLNLYDIKPPSSDKKPKKLRVIYEKDESGTGSVGKSFNNIDFEGGRELQGISSTISPRFSTEDSNEDSSIGSKDVQMEASFDDSASNGSLNRSPQGEEHSPIHTMGKGHRGSRMNS